MVPIIAVWSWSTIHVYSDTREKKKNGDLKLDMAGKWALRLGLIILCVAYAFVDDGGPIALL